MFAVAILGMVVFGVIYILGLERTQPYATLVNITSGFVIGTLCTGLLYASRYISKLKASRTRLKKALLGVKQAHHEE